MAKVVCSPPPPPTLDTHAGTFLVFARPTGPHFCLERSGTTRRENVGLWVSTIGAGLSGWVKQSFLTLKGFESPPPPYTQTSFMEPAPLLFSESDDFHTLTIFSNVLIQFSFGLVQYSPSLWG